jgi:hypothetical protein
VPAELKKKPKLKGIFILAVLLLFGGGGLFWFSTQDIALPWLEQPTFIDTGFPETPAEPDIVPETELADDNCDAFIDYLETCTPHKCKFDHFFTLEKMEREIFGIIGDDCRYVEEMPNNGQMECHFSESLRLAVVQYYRDVEAAEIMEGSVSWDPEGISATYLIDGVETSNPLQMALDTGVCVITGY